jgi:hypothetical protein
MLYVEEEVVLEEVVLEEEGVEVYFGSRKQRRGQTRFKKGELLFYFAPCRFGIIHHILSHL